MLATRPALRLASSIIVATVLGAMMSGPAIAQVILALPDDEPAAAKHPANDKIKSGMAGIRKLVIDAHTLITHRRQSPDAARRFASEVKRHVADLKSDPAAAPLTATLDAIATGADQIAAPGGGDGKLDGLDKIETALARYPQLFDDPDWKPLR